MKYAIIRSDGVIELRIDDTGNPNGIELTSAEYESAMRAQTKDEMLFIINQAKK